MKVDGKTYTYKAVLIDGFVYNVNGMPYILVNGQWVKLQFASEAQTERFFSDALEGKITKFEA